MTYLVTSRAFLNELRWRLAPSSIDGARISEVIETV